MELQPEQITVAVTVFSRRQFVAGAIRSVLAQTIPVKVIVVEDCGPDPSLRQFIVGEFGSRVEYFRNQRNRGLFDNWNACMEYCATPWISILHDDDLLHPWWAETMLQLTQDAPQRMLYFGRSGELDQRGQTHPATPASWGKNWRETNLVEFAKVCLVLFPGQLFQIADARAVGGVRPNSYFTGDWDLWFRLALRGGAAQTAREVSVVRSHLGAERGSSRVDRMGWKWALDNVQRKRNLAMLRSEKGIQIPFDRKELLSYNPVPTRAMLRHAHGFSRRVLAYNSWLYVQSPPPHAMASVLMWLVRRLGPGALRGCSLFWKTARLGQVL
jgi:GT2 family glycosyltransferase